MTAAWVLGAAAGVLGMVQVVPYLASIVRGRTRPSRTGTGIFSGVSVVTFAAMLAGGAGAGTVLPAVFAATGLTTFALAVRYGVAGASRLDVAVAGLAVLAMAGWLVAGAGVAIVWASVASACGYAATLAKMTRLPGREAVTAWAITAIAGVCSLGALVLVAPQTVAAFVSPVTTIVGAGAVTVLGWRQWAVERATRRTAEAAYEARFGAAVAADARIWDSEATCLYASSLGGPELSDELDARYAATAEQVSLARKARRAAMISEFPEFAVMTPAQRREFADAYADTLHETRAGGAA